MVFQLFAVVVPTAAAKLEPSKLLASVEEDNNSSDSELKFYLTGYNLGKKVSDVNVTGSGDDNGLFYWSYGGLLSSSDSLNSLLGSKYSPEDDLKEAQYYAFVNPGQTTRCLYVTAALPCALRRTA